MKKKFKVFIVIILLLFICCTFSTVMNNTFSKDPIGGYDVLGISKNVTITEDNKILVSDAIAIDFKDYNANLLYKIPLIDENYDVEIKDFDFITAGSNETVTAKIGKQTNFVTVKVKNNGFIGKDNILISYVIDKGEDYNDQNDSFKFSLFDKSYTNSVDEITYSFTFPKVINEDKIYIFNGDKISNEEFNLRVSGNIAAGSYQRHDKLGLVNPVTFTISFEEGYFEGERNNQKANNIMTLIYLIITIIFVLLWFFKGKDESIIPNPTFYSPSDFSPLEVGFWIDNNIDYSDIFFLVLYWANYGYIKITKLSKGDDTNGRSNYVFTKLRDIDINRPEYEKVLFNALFELGKTDDTNNEFNTKIFRTETDALYGTLQTYAQEVGRAEEMFNDTVKKDLIESYDQSAEALFGFMKFASLMLWVISIYFFAAPNAFSFIDFLPLITVIITVLLSLFVSKDTFFLYIIYSSPILLLVSFATIDVRVLVLIIADLFLTAIVRKKTFKYNDLLGKLFGFRNVIAKSKYKMQINEIAQRHPNYFYDVLPYALVLFKSKHWCDQFDVIENPDWYTSMDGENLSKENIYDFIKEFEYLSEEVLKIVNASATADKKEQSREGLDYVTANERIRANGLDPNDFDNDNY